MDVNNIIKLKDVNNKSVIINLSDIVYFDSDYTAVTSTISEDILLIHNIEKIADIINKANTTSKFIYLHNTNNEAILCNIEHIAAVTYNANKLATQIWFNVNKFTLDVAETVDNIYNKILEYKSSKTDIDNNANTNKVKQTSLANTVNDVRKESKKIPVLTRVYLKNKKDFERILSDGNDLLKILQDTINKIDRVNLCYNNINDF